MTWRSLEPRQVRVRLCEAKEDKEVKEKGEEEGSILILNPFQLISHQSFLVQKRLHCSAHSLDIWSLNTTWTGQCLHLTENISHRLCLDQNCCSLHNDNSCHLWNICETGKGECSTAQPFFFPVWYPDGQCPAWVTRLTWSKDFKAWNLLIAFSSSACLR